MQFFDVDGIEMDIQDQTFFMDDELLITYYEAIQSMINNNF
jgi:hypothetical protein